MLTTAPSPDARNGLIKSAAAAKDEVPNGLASEEARQFDGS